MRFSTFASKFLIFLLVLYAAFYTPDSSAAPKRSSVANNKYAALIVDARTGDILHQENSNSLRYPASLTKMMTLYLTFEALESGKLKMNQKVYVSSHAANQPRMNMGLHRGEQMSIKDAVMCLIVKSANDAAVVLGEAIAGSENQFALLMTNKARKLGMSRTTFQNASGLHSPRQRTTARDLAKLVIALQRDYPQYYTLFSRTSFSYKGRVFVGHNRVTKNYPGADGVKTGFVRASGYNLASSALRDGNRLVGVVLGGKTSISRDRRMMALLDASFSRLKPIMTPRVASASPTTSSKAVSRGEVVKSKKAVVRKKKYLKKNSLDSEWGFNPASKHHLA